ncbi:dihydrodipicolinate synthase family protein [Candidatus Formimonas warabiya]|uniref:Dihydrodipicolinate synthase family protein n=1 Tax=Formimonas warabiya TaxID=1761012 RepID=A0A3G1KUQ8_FORW1|nr:dihydrodipicolinate synthase family protein [Candidatus Formimonas warabiya]ATW26176.1 hypothetical protein DCMF_16620 [Candidatus Formimonas warabiya]
MTLTLEERKKRLFGNHALTVTPFKECGELDEESTRKLIDYIIEQGVHGILTLGSSGEVFALTVDERKKYVEIAVDQAKGRVPVGVGVNHSSSDEAVLLAKHAASVGADYIFTCPPYYHPHREEGVYRHVKHIADAVKDLPLMVYDGGAGIEISLPLLKRMADTIPNLTCAKLFLPYPQKIALYNGATEGKVQAWAGHDQMNFQMLLYGAQGMTTIASCVLPKEQSDMFNLIQNGQLDEARDIYYKKVCPLSSIAFCNVLQYIQCYKYALRKMDIIASDKCKVVMEPLDNCRKAEMDAVLKFIGVI